MQHIYVNFKRFDVPSTLGGVNHIAPVGSYGESVVKATRTQLEKHDPKEVEFTQFYPEAQIPGALHCAMGSPILSVGCQGVYRRDVEKGGNFGAFTTLRPASAMSSLGCTATIIGHCEERNDKNELLALGGNKDRTLVNRIFNQEIKCAQNREMKVLYCIGEKAEETGDWDKVLTEQLEIALDGCDTKHVVIGYEPVWSIGPGKTPAGKEYITKVARLIKRVVPGIQVVYGGGLKKENAEMLASIDEIDGGLIALTQFSGEIGFYPEQYLEIISLYMAGKGVNYN
jgi:triosephosphate isomerase